MTAATPPVVFFARCQAAEQTLLEQRLFMASGTQYQALMDLLNQPEQPNEGLRDLFSRKAPWDVA